MDGNKLVIATTLKKFENEESVVSSKLTKNKKILFELHRLGAIVCPNSGKGRVKRGEHYYSYIERHFNGNLERFLTFKSRAEGLHEFGSDKIKTINPMRGLYLWRGFDGLSGDVEISNTEGVLTFIGAGKICDLNLAKKVTIVGVENFEVMVCARSIMENLLPAREYIFAYRNETFLDWIKTTEHRLLYLPDYDIYGVRIFETEILPRRIDAELFCPGDLKDAMLRFKSKNPKESMKMYLEDMNKKGSDYKPLTDVGNEIIKAIKENKCVLRQEFFIF